MATWSVQEPETIRDNEGEDVFITKITVNNKVFSYPYLIYYTNKLTLFSKSFVPLLAYYLPRLLTTPCKSPFTPLHPYLTTRLTSY